uniref:Uncharacterized protein n=1 Tax=uncultured Thiotrichaceae bacterium TaxID=298394 RepID=A0A6S6UP42_9GAMM|nr:MAG: Unknown protein [uncultured Thiotrichaceae bacterium]
MKYVFCIIIATFSFINNLYAEDFTLLGSFKNSLITSGDPPGYISLALSADGSRLALLETTPGNNDLPNDHAIVSVRNTSNGELLNQKKIDLDPSVTANTYLINLKFSKDNTTIIIGMQPPARNLTWSYQTDSSLKDSCFAYMGSIVEKVSPDGDLFSVITAEGNTLLCGKGAVTEQHKELFDFEGLKGTLGEKGQSIRSEGFHDGKLVISYQSKQFSEKTNELFSRLKDEKPFLEILAFKNDYADKNLATQLDSDNNTFYSIDKFNRTIVLSIYNSTSQSLVNRYKFKVINGSTEKVGAYIDGKEIVVDTERGFYIFNAGTTTATFVKRIDKKEISDLPKKITTRLDTYNVAYSSKYKLALKSIELALNESFSNKYISYFAEDSLVTKSFFFEHTACDTTNTNAIPLKNPLNSSVLKGGVLAVSEGEDTLLTCLGDTYYLYGID